jgi:hypothetical protein
MISWVPDGYPPPVSIEHRAKTTFPLAGSTTPTEIDGG